MGIGEEVSLKVHYVQGSSRVLGWSADSQNSRGEADYVADSAERIVGGGKCYRGYE